MGVFYNPMMSRPDPNLLWLIQWLVEQGAKINAKTVSGETVLHYAAWSGNVKLVEWLIKEKGLKINAKGSIEWSVLHFAAERGHLELVQWLLKKTGYQCAFYLPYDIVMHRIRASEYQREIIRASGCFYGMKPYEFEPFIAHQKAILRQSYETLEAAVRKL